MATDAAAQWLYPEMPAGAVAVSTTRAGGVSAGCYAGLNLADHVGDVPEAVARNRAVLLRRLGCSRIQWLTQVHGRRCIRASSRSTVAVPEADAGWTDQPDLAVAVLTADCLPVVLCALDGTGIAVAHAGWRGLCAGLLSATLECLPVAANKVHAWVGPGISANCYEVGDDVLRAAQHAHSHAPAFFSPAAEPGKYQFDLVGLARYELQQLGVREILGGDTCCASDRRFYSYRRDGVTGRMATVAWLAR